MKFALVPLYLVSMAAHVIGQGTTFDFTPTSDCTMTIVQTTGAPLPPFGWKPTWTFTHYTTTKTATEIIDCGACRRLLTATLIIDFFYPDAPYHVNTEITATEPTTVVDFQCGKPSFPFVNARPTDPPGLFVPGSGDAAGQLVPTPIPVTATPLAILAVGSPEVAPRDVPADPIPSIEELDPIVDAFESPPLIAVDPPHFGPDQLEDPIFEDIGFPALPVVQRGKKKSLCTKLLLQPPDFTWGPTKTMWTKTETYTESIDCGGCPNLVHSVLPLGVPPVAIFTATTTVDVASTTTVFACSATPLGPSRQLSPIPIEPTGRPQSTLQDPDDYFPELTKTVTPQGVLHPSCTTSAWLDPFIPDSTLTVYPGTVTSITTADCGSCELHWWTGVVFFFAPIYITATTTVDWASTKTDIACSAVVT